VALAAIEARAGVLKFGNRRAAEAFVCDIGTNPCQEGEETPCA
jgi:hypothetical protein